MKHGSGPFFYSRRKRLSANRLNALLHIVPRHRTSGQFENRQFSCIRLLGKHDAPPSHVLGVLSRFRAYTGVWRSLELRGWQHPLFISSQLLGFMAPTQADIVPTFLYKHITQSRPPPHTAQWHTFRFIN